MSRPLGELELKRESVKGQYQPKSAQLFSSAFVSKADSK